MNFFKKVVFATACLAFLSGTAHAESPAEWEAAIATKSPRLILFSLLKENPRGSGRVQLAFARSLGFTHRENDRLRLGRPQISLTPILKYDENVNGGIPGESFNLGPFEFKIDEDSRAKAGYVLGASISATFRLIYARGSSLDFNLGATFRHAPAIDVTRQTTQSSVCMNHYVGSWTWLSTCSGYRYDDARDLGEKEESTFNSLGATKVLSTALGVARTHRKCQQ